MLRNITSLVALLVVMVLSAVNGLAQAPLNRSVAVSAGTYAEITGGTVIWNNTTPNWSSAADVQIALPFNVVYAGTTYNSLWVDGGGSISFGSSNTFATPLQNGLPCVSALGGDLTSAAGGDVTWNVTGVAPNRILTVQWRNATRSYVDNIARDLYNFQIRVWESNAAVNGSRIDIVYGNMTVTASKAIQVGATNGSTETLSCNVGYYTASWSRPHFGSTASLAQMTSTSFPSNGMTISFRERQAPAHNNDVGVIRLASPTAKFAPGTSQSIQAVVRNWGSNNVDSLVIDWSVNGATQTPVKFYPQPALAPGQERTVILGDMTFAPFSFNTVSIGTSLPNGQADINTGNDRHVTEIAPRVQGNLVIAKNGNPNTFPSITAMLRHVATAGLSGSVTAEIRAGEYEEQVIIPAIDIAAGTLTITKPASEAVTIRNTVHPANPTYGIPSTASVVSFLDGAVNVTLKNLTVVANNASRSGLVIGGGGIGNVTIDDCTIKGPVDYQSIVTGFTTLSLSNQSNRGPVAIVNNRISQAMQGLSLDANAVNNTIANNTITDFRTGAMYVSGAAPTISKNIIQSCDCGTFSEGMFIFNTNGARITDNQINIVKTTGDVRGIALLTSNNGIVSNNTISAGGSTQSVGIWTEANPGVSNNYWHNSVNIVGIAPATTSTALYVVNNGGTVNLVNNIFHNFGQGAGAGYAAWYTSATPNPLGTADFNNLMTTGTNLVNWGGALVPRNAGANPLGSWRAGSGRDQNSSSVAVNFVGATDLHLLSIQRELFGSSRVLSIVTNDIDGDVRTMPYMGADEIKPQIAMVRQPESAYVCVGSVDTLIAIADVTTGATTTYQWFKDGVELTGQTGNILVLNNAQYTTAGVYTCLVKANDGRNFIQLASAGATVMVVRPTQITDQPTSQPVADGGSFNLSIAAEAIGAPTNFVPGYQWMKRAWNPLTTSYEDTPINDDGRITGSQSSMLTVRNAGAADTAGTYVCQVTGYCGTVTSKAARVFIPLVAVSNMTPNLCEGGTLNLDLRANPTRLPEGNATFQWMKNGVEIKGAVAPALEVKNFSKSDNGTYTCVMSFGSKDLTFTSNEVTVTAGAAPEFTRQPEGVTICEGKVLTLSAAAAGDNVQFQWMKGTQVLANETASTFSRLAADADAGSYSVVITNTCGTKTSTAVDVVVDPLAKISTQPADVQFAQGGKITLSVVAAGRNIYNYQWYVNDVAIPGATNATLEINNATTANAGTYYCEVTNLCGAVKTRNAVASITTGVTEDVVAGGYLLSTAFPNPTFDASSITFAVPAAQNVRVTVSDLMGRELGVLVNEVVESGSHVIKFRASEFNLTAGAYNVTMNAGGFVATQQVVVVK
jgi:hypothetical protein